MLRNVLVKMIRQTTDLLRLQTLVRAKGYQVTLMIEDNSIYIADPLGVGCIFDTHTGAEVLKKLAL